MRCQPQCGMHADPLSCQFSVKRSGRGVVSRSVLVILYPLRADCSRKILIHLQRFPAGIFRDLYAFATDPHPGRLVLAVDIAVAKRDPGSSYGCRGRTRANLAAGSPLRGWHLRCEYGVASFSSAPASRYREEGRRRVGQRTEQRACSQSSGAALNWHTLSKGPFIGTNEMLVTCTCGFGTAVGFHSAASPARHVCLSNHSRGLGCPANANAGP